MDFFDYSIVDSKLKHEILKELMNKLTDREKIVLKCRYEDKKTLKETGEVIERSRERARAIQAKAERKLKYYAVKEKKIHIFLDMEEEEYNKKLKEEKKKNLREEYEKLIESIKENEYQLKSLMDNIRKEMDTKVLQVKQAKERLKTNYNLEDENLLVFLLRKDQQNKIQYHRKCENLKYNLKSCREKATNILKNLKKLSSS